MFHYRLHDAAGDDLGEATYSFYVNVGDMIYGRDGRELRVVDLVPVEEEESPLVGLLMVQMER